MTVLSNRWPLRALSDVCDLITDGSHFSPKTVDAGYPYITVRDLNENGIDFANCKFISQESFDELQRNGCRPIKGDILFSKDGTVGKVAQVLDDTQFVVLSSLAILRPNKDLITSEFLKLALRSPMILESALGMKTGTALRRVVLRNLKTLEIPLPPLPEQQKIVEILEDHLSRLDAALADVKQAKLKADQFRRSLLQAAFNAKFSDDPNGVRDVTFDKVFQVGKTAGKSVKQKEYLSEGKFPVIDQGDEFISGYSNDASLLLDFNAPVVVFGDHTRRLKYINFPFIPGADGTKVLIPDPVLNPKFVYYQLLSKELRDRGYARHFSELRKEVFWVPPHGRQFQIVEVIEEQLSRLNAAVAIAHEMEKQSSSLRRSLLHSAFTGQLTKEVSSV